MVKEPDQLRIKEIESKFVGFDMPYCYKHRQWYRVREVIRSVNEAERRLEVTRKCICRKCREADPKAYKLVTNSRVFKNSVPDTDLSRKVPNDEN